MARGGKREGAGRKAGVPNKATTENRRTISEAAREFTPLAIRVLAEVAQKSESDAARVSAANAILDRAYGKPAQAVGGDPDNPIRVVHTIERRIVRAGD